MQHQYDTIIIGGGTMGIATAFHLAERGQKTLVLEQFGLVHDQGAHGGHSRIIRKAYFEHPDYVPLLLRAYENWAKLEVRTGIKVYHETGIIYFGQPGDTLLANTKASAATYGLPLETHDMAWAKQHYPMFAAIPDHWDCLFEPEAGFLMVEKCLLGYAQAALQLGADLHAHEPALSWTATEEGVTVTTAKGAYKARKLVVTAGAWANTLLKTMEVPLNVTRQILGWVQPLHQPEAFLLGRFPCWFVSDPEQGLYYGKPMMPDGMPLGLKVGAHHLGQTVDPNRVDRAISAADEADFRVALEKYIPWANGPLLHAKTCLYANSPDGDFIIDHLPNTQNVIFACGFSGHGFKFAAVIGEALADLAQSGTTHLPIGFLGLQRFKTH